MTEKSPVDIAEPPFIAYKEAYYLFGMSSGVKVNKDMQVVDANWDPIPGLCNAYAACNGYFAGKNAALAEAAE